MFGFGQLFDYEREELAKPFWFWLRKRADNELSEIAADLWGVFDLWKSEQADSDGMVTVPDLMAAPNRGGLLGILAPGPTKRIPVEEATPYECAGPDVKNEIDLAFKLWLDKYAPMAELLGARGFTKVFALVGILEYKSAAPSSLIRLNGFLVEQLIGIAIISGEMAEESFNEKRARREQLAQSRLLAAAGKKLTRAEDDGAIMRMAVDYKIAHPAADRSDTAHHIATTLKGTKAEKSVGTIMRKIAGLRAAVRKRQGEGVIK